MTSKMIDWMLVICWAAIIFWLSSIPNLRTELPTAWDTVLRKIGHAVEFGVLALLILKAMEPLNKQKISTAAIISLIYAISDEIHQRFVPGRQSDVNDIIIDAIGIAIVSLRAINKIKQKPQ